METIDINKVAGLQALDAEGNALGIISLENLTDMVASRMATELASQNTAMPAMRTMSLTSSPVAASVAATGVDKTEAELSDVSDPGYVRVIDKTGNSGKQGMQQFASVVGGLNGKFKFEGDIGTYGIKDFNEAIETGFYRIVIGDGNIPHRPGNIGYGVMHVLNTGTYRLQVAFDLFTSEAWFRGGDGGFNDIWHKFNQ